MVRRTLALLMALLLSSCATLTGETRVLLGSLGGGALGAGGGALLSPNDESRGLNALVFGLSGALLGGGIAYLTDPGTKVPEHPTDLRSRELGHLPESQNFVVTPPEGLPEFVRKRLSPVVIEEFIERDRVSEEGTLHEPHKAYRIKRPAELTSGLQDTGSPDESGAGVSGTRGGK